MSYERTNWVNGETPINADNLNNMEKGILDAHEDAKTKVLIGVDLLESVLAITQPTEIYFNGQCTNKPSTNGGFASVKIHASNREINATDIVTHIEYKNIYFNGAWSGWQQQATNSDLANYLPLSGGTLNNVFYGPGFFVRKNGVQYGYITCQIEGTATTNGLGSFTLGNNTPSGANGNARGVLNMYGPNKAYTVLETSNNTETNNNVKLPSTNGTLALQSEVQALETRIAQLEAALGVATTNIENTEEIE